MTDTGSAPPDPTRVSATQVTGREASQGRKGTGVFRILVISLVLVVVAFAAIYAANKRGLSTNHGAGGQSGIINQTEAGRFHAPAPAAKPNPPPTDSGSANTSGGTTPGGAST